MREELVVGHESPLFKPKLQKLAVAAERAHLRARKCAAKSVENMVRAGQALRKFRDLADDKEWDGLIVNHFDGSERTVQRYMYLAKHWSLLEAHAPPDALTSQRKALQLLRTLLYGEEAAGQAAGTRRKRLAPTVIDVASAPPGPDGSGQKPAADPTAATSGAQDEERNVAIRRMYDNMLRVLSELTKELNMHSPPHYVVRHAVDAIRRAEQQLVEDAQTLFHAQGNVDGDVDCTDPSAPAPRAACSSRETISPGP